MEQNIDKTSKRHCVSYSPDKWKFKVWTGTTNDLKRHHGYEPKMTFSYIKGAFLNPRTPERTLKMQEEWEGLICEPSDARTTATRHNKTVLHCLAMDKTIHSPEYKFPLVAWWRVSILIRGGNLRQGNHIYGNLSGTCGIILVPIGNPTIAIYCIEVIHKNASCLPNISEEAKEDSVYIDSTYPKETHHLHGKPIITTLGF